MQTTKREISFPSINRQNLCSRTKQRIHTSGCQQKQCKKAAPLPFAGNDFLKTAFPVIPTHTVGCGLQFEPFEIKQLTGRESKYIINSANNYLRLLGFKEQLLSTGNLDTDCVLAYDALVDKIPSGQTLNFDFHRGRYSLVILSSYWDNIPTYKTFYLPIGGIEHMCSETASLFKQFIAFFTKLQYIDFATDHYYFAQIIEGESLSEEDDDDILDSIDSYNNGIAGDTFKEIRKMIPKPTKLKSAIRSYLKSVNRDNILLTQMLEGIQLLQKDSICRYNIPPADDEFYCFFDSLFAVIWHDDVIAQYARDITINEINESSEYPMPYDVQSITPKDTKLVTRNTFPIDFIDWWHQFTKTLLQYEEKYY